jgi:SAM-dependent methyltransferase
MKTSQDAYGKQLLAQYNHQTPLAEIIERDDNYVATGSDDGLYFTEYDEWSPLERCAIEFAKGRILDIGCGAGRHAIYLQVKGFDVTGIDNSPGAIKVCKARGLKKALVRPISEVDKFKANSFDTIQMFGNNFGLFGSFDAARLILKKFSRITAPKAQIIAQSRNPYQTTEPEHLAYHRLNKRRGRMGGQLRMRVRFGKTIGEWFDYLFVSPAEMQNILKDTDWQIKEFLEPEAASYFAVIGKKSGK